MTGPPMEAEAWEANSRRIGALFYHIRDAVAVLDSAWRIRRWNPAGERLFGFAEDRLVGQPFASLFSDGQQFAETRRSLESGAGPAAGTLRSQIGRLIPVSCRAVPLDGESAGPGGLAVLIQEESPAGVDTAGLALIRQLHQLAEATAVIVAQPDVVKVAQSLTDLAKVLVGADFSAMVLVEPIAGGYRAVGFTFNAPRHLFPMDKDHPDAVGILAMPLERKAIVRIADVRRHPGSVGIPVHHPPVAAFVGVPLLHQDAVVGELLVANRVGRPAFTDLQEALLAQLGTIAGAMLENARLHAEVAEHAERAERLDARRRAAMAAIAHDLRTPGGAVQGYAELAADSRLPEEKRAFLLERLAKQAQQLNRLIDDLVTAARLDVETLTVDPVRVDLQELLEEIRSDYRLRFADRAFQLAGPTCPAIADRQRLHQVLTNLVDNALKYSTPGTDVVIETGFSNTEVFITVIDEGRGMSRDDLKRIFEPFYRTDSARSQTGMGLGLTIVEGLMQAMGGDVSVESEVGRGSRFKLTLPRAQEVESTR